MARERNSDDFHFINRLVSMDTSHLAEHAGAAGAFCSIFVVATLSMRTMIPLRVFGILTNIILIPPRFRPTIATLILHSVLLRSTPIACTRCCSWFAT
jgi:hypothetical protein